MLVFNPNNLTDTHLHMGGYIDANGNLFTEKMCLEDDYSLPVLLGKHEYEVTETRVVNYSNIINQDIIGITLNNKEGVSTLVLTRKEFDSSVCSKALL